MFTKVTDSAAAATSDGRVQANFDLVASKEQAAEFVGRHINGNGAYFLVAIPALPMDKLAPVERKDDAGNRIKTGKLSLTGEVSPLQLQTEDGAIARVSPGRGNFWLGFEIVQGPIKRINAPAA